MHELFSVEESIVRDLMKMNNLKRMVSSVQKTALRVETHSSKTAMVIVLDSVARPLTAGPSCCRHPDRKPSSSTGVIG